MEKPSKSYWYVWATVGICLGALLAYAMFPRVEIEEKVVYNDKVVETVREVEVVKEVQRDYTKELITDFLNKVETDEDYDSFLVCNKERYDFDQVSVSRVYDKYTVVNDRLDTDDLDEAEAYTTSVKLRVKFTDPDTEDKCYRTVDVTGKYLEGETPKISYK